MAVVCDFSVIQGDSNVWIGDPPGKTLWETTFRTGGRRSTGQCFLMFMVKGLTVATEPVDIKINNKSVGKIYPYTNADHKQWFTQIVNVGSGILKNGDNELQIEAISYPDATSGDLYDNFALRDIVCFFQQSA